VCRRASIVLSHVKSQVPSFAVRNARSIGAALTAALGLIFGFLHLGRGVADLSFDLPFYFRPPMDVSDVVIVYMDDESHRDLGEPANKAWHRTNHARLLDRLVECRARAVIFDVHFDVSSPEDGVFLR